MDTFLLGYYAFWDYEELFDVPGIWISSNGVKHLNLFLAAGWHTAEHEVMTGMYKEMVVHPVFGVKLRSMIL